MADVECKRNLKYMKLVFHYLISYSLHLLIIIPILLIGISLTTVDLDDVSSQVDLIHNKLLNNPLTASLILICVLLTWTIYLTTRPRKVYLVNFSCYKPKDTSQMCSGERLLEIATNSGMFREETLVFKKKIMDGAGIGSKSYLPISLLNDPVGCKNMTEARKETEAVMVGAVEELLGKTGVKAGDIGVLIVNCCMFCPTPSLSAMIVNRFKLRRSVLSYNFGGMGCTAGLNSIDLAQRLLQTVPNTYALVVSSENILLNWYPGNERSMAISNCVFRMGGAAMLLSNRSSERRRSKYELVKTLRTHMGADDRSYNCIFQLEDAAQKSGIKVSKDLTVVIGQALKKHIASVGPLVLPLSEKLLYVANLAARKVFNGKTKPYIPDFKMAFEHFCVHVGGKPVLDEVEKNLELKEWHMEPSRMALYRFGNTSSSSVWYVLAYAEAKGRIRKGDRIWQVAFGSGVKCSSVVWRALKSIHPAHEKKNPWMDEIDDFPIDVSTLPQISFFIKK